MMEVSGKESLLLDQGSQICLLILITWTLKNKQQQMKKKYFLEILPIWQVWDCNRARTPLNGFYQFQSL